MNWECQKRISHSTILEYNKLKNRALIIFFLTSVILNSCSRNSFKAGRIAGFTQGTTYSIVFDSTESPGVNEVKVIVEKVLKDVDMSLSVYNDSSVISRLNRNETNIPDSMFTEVFNRSKEISELSGGAFDITVMPLVKAWGFGPDEHKNFDKEKIDSLLSLVGFEKAEIRDGVLIKSDPRITIDVNAIAQGYTVDVICRAFDKMGMMNYLIEVGGEVRVKGNKGSEPWKIGIDKPVDDNMIPGAELQAIVKLTNKALATSGNYRKFYVEDGVKYSHTIDPKTGYPAKNRLLSASIIASDCATADGIATACMVMGVEKAIGLIKDNKDLEGYLVYSDDDGSYRSWISEELEKNIKEEK
jgi:thiamine biosynthesis lipoprotein